MINVSIAAKSGIICILLSENGFIVKKDYLTYTDTNVHTVGIQALNRMILDLREYINANSIPEDQVTIEIRNKAIIKWCEDRKADDMHEYEFEEFYREFNKLPILYRFVYNANPYAMRFIKDYKPGNKLKLSSLEV